MRAIYRTIPERKFGVELEITKKTTKRVLGNRLEEYETFLGLDKPVCVTEGVRGWAESRGNNYWHVKYDSSCGPLGKNLDHGWEIASYVGEGPSDIRNISHAAQFMASIGQQSTNRNCGLHIHVEAKDLSIEEMGCLLARWLKVESILYKICSPHRSESEYCRPLRQRMLSRAGFYPSSPECLWNYLSPDSYDTHNNPEKKYSINTVGYAIGLVNPRYLRQTVELRMPECLLEEDHVRCWTTIFVNFVESCVFSAYPCDGSTCSSLSEFLHYLGLDSCDGQIICDYDLWSAKCWLLKKLANAGLFKISEDAADHLDFISRI